MVQGQIWLQGRYERPNQATPTTRWKGVNGEQVRAIIERLVYVGVASDRIIDGLSHEEF